MNHNRYTCTFCSFDNATAYFSLCTFSNTLFKFTSIYENSSFPYVCSSLSENCYIRESGNQFSIAGRRTMRLSVKKSVSSVLCMENSEIIRNYSPILAEKYSKRVDFHSKICYNISEVEVCNPAVVIKYCLWQLGYRYHEASARL